MTERQGVEIDYCPKCRGVWLDRGELQKLIDLSLAQVGSQAASSAAGNYRADQGAPVYTEEQYRRYEDSRYQPRREDSHYGYGKPKKRESWLGELFDWD